MTLMAFHCKDCSYRGSKSGQLGECPGCGSYNIAQDTKALKKKKGSGQWRLALLILLWGYLAVEIGSKLNQ